MKEFWYGSHIRGLLEWGEGTLLLPRILFWALATGNDLRVQIFLVLPAILPTKTIATLTHWALSLTVTSLIPSDSQVLSILWSLLNVGPHIFCCQCSEKVTYHTFVDQNRKAWLLGKVLLGKLAFPLWLFLLSLLKPNPFFLVARRKCSAAELIIYQDKSCVYPYKCLLYGMCSYTTTMSLSLNILGDNNNTYVSDYMCIYALKTLGRIHLRLRNISVLWDCIRLNMIII